MHQLLHHFYKSDVALTIGSIALPIGYDKINASKFHFIVF
ncbi:hypothetical protein JCM19239_6350 [Vibrio variabilis]|uniref:Uncharacterized protein n=1 Tax=Vibrio variabilis TaxID=990271 RepID=A0ABQ0JB27_9VIBR|nr:hypothetical protein JCM19239_6350 [Vibrio variabilis]